MSTHDWDPLYDNQEDLHLIAASKKRQIQNILKSYVGMYDPFSELIQNAMDAVDIRSSRLNEEDYEKKIWIKIDLQDNILSVTDNGIGFNASEFRSFLAPNISFKEGSKTRGNKGVGSTYLAFGFNYLQLGTKHPDYTHVSELSDGRKWVDDKEGIVTKPIVKQSEAIHEAFKKNQRGSTFTIKLGGFNTRPKQLSWFGATTANQWLSLLLIKTPLGNIDFFDKSEDKICIEIEVVDENGVETGATEDNVKFLYPHLKIPASASLKDMAQMQQKLISESKPLINMPAKFLRLNGIYEFYTTEELESLPTQKIGEEEKELIRQYSVTAYGYFCYSTEVWDELSDKILRLRKGTRVLKGGLQLANNFMIQGDLLAIPLTSNIGYQNQTMVIVHFVNADPDLGRKGFQPELKELGEFIALGIVNRLKAWRHHLKTDTGARPNISSSDDVFTWINHQIQYEKDFPLKITNRNFFQPINEIAITSIPQTEQDVIVLFNQLIAGGVIRGVKLLATDQKQQYDGVFKYYVQDPVENHLYELEKNPLGVSHLEVVTPYSSRPWVLEYKFSVDALIREFENEEKKEGEINLIVAWDLGKLWHKKYDVISLLDIDNLHHREFHGITHIFHSGDMKFYGVILSDLIEYLNDFEGAQVVQKAKYQAED